MSDESPLSAKEQIAQGQRVEVCRGKAKGQRGVVTGRSMGAYIVRLDGEDGLQVYGRRTIKPIRMTGSN